MSQTDVCDGVLRTGVDYVYISNRLDSSQSSIVSDLNEALREVDGLMVTDDKDCQEMIYRVICQYYLPSCGNHTHQLPPSSLCQDECEHVQKKCSATWNAFSLAFNKLQFISCEDTSQLLFPLPHCCTGAGIETCEHLYFVCFTTSHTIFLFHRQNYDYTR